MANLDLKDVVPLVSSFRIPGWSGLEPEEAQIEPITHGYINTTCILKKKSGDTSNGPGKILFRKFGNDRSSDLREVVKVNSPMVQNLIAHELSKRNWGPRVFGVFEKGRIEEFVDCHTLNHEESFEHQISKDMARAFARLHSLELPVKKEPKNSLVDFLPHIEDTRNSFSDWMQKDAKELLGEPNIKDQNLEALLTFPIEEEINWFMEVESQIEQRIVLCHLDPSYLNILARHKDHFDPSETRVWIIDFDISAYSQRGRDLGGFFVERTLNWAGKETKWSGKPYPNEAERTFFLQSYLDEFGKLTSDLDSNSLDSIEHLATEVHLHSMSHILIYTVLFLGCHNLVKDDPFFYSCLNPYLNLYWELKESFIHKNVHFADENQPATESTATEMKFDF